MKKKLVSIIIPVYNCEKYLEKCIVSVIKQDYKDIEILLIDDGSTDSSFKICKKYSNIDDRIIVIHKKNNGVASARNEGIKKAKGDYICFVDSDDKIDSKFVSILLENALNTNSYISAVKDIKIKDMNLEKNYRGKNNIELLSKDDALNGLINGIGFLSSCWNKMYKKNVIKNTIFKNIAVGEDLQFNYEVIKNNDGNIVLSNIRLYYYNVGSTSSIIHNSFKEKNLDIINEYEYLIEETNKEYPIFNENLKKSFVFINIKLLIKMISSEYYNEDIYNRCISLIFKYKKTVLRSKYSFLKKLFIVYFTTFYRQFINSYNKSNIYKKICIFLNRKVG